uniref:Exoribonuclease phosphorolytic domain-containing protein n=1 Tax=Ditylenchus dipsaci TaxID=166011 RepID=A0A915DAA1_9BILA
MSAKSASIKGRISFLKHPDGACEIEHGKSRIWCAINGPGDVQSSKRIFDRVNVMCDFNRLPFATDKIEISKSNNVASTSNIANKFIADVIESAIDTSAYPRTCLQVCSQEIKVDGLMDSLLINGLCLALLDCGVRLKHIFCAVAVCKCKRIAKEEEIFVVEPNQLDLVSAESVYTFVFKPSLTAAGGGDLMANDSSGSFSSEDYEKALKLAQSECLPIFDFYRRQIYEKFGHSLKN